MQLAVHVGQNEDILHKKQDILGHSAYIHLLGHFEIFQDKRPKAGLFQDILSSAVTKSAELI